MRESLWRVKHVIGLDGLKNAGTISQNLFDKANEVRLWGNMAKHEGLHESITASDAEDLLTYVELILNAVYVEPAKLANLKQKRESVEHRPKTT
jgi:Domain of unknown function (DUF4145)